jgi:hypothetical protein
VVAPLALLGRIEDWNIGCGGGVGADCAAVLPVASLHACREAKPYFCAVLSSTIGRFAIDEEEELVAPEEEF